MASIQSSMPKDSRFVDLTGRTFESLLVLSYAGRRQYPAGGSQHLWLCECKCGSTKVITGTSLNGGQKTCGCERVLPGNRSGSWRGCGAIPGAYWSRVLKRAKENGLKVSVTIKQADQLLASQEMMCALSGMPIGFVSGKQCTASLDRIDPDGGYNSLNVQWLHKMINVMKWDLPQDRFILLCNAVAGRRVADDLPRLDIPTHIANRSNHKLWRGIGFINGTFFKNVRGGLQRGSRSIRFCLEKSDIWEMFISQNGRCLITGIPIHFDLEGVRGSGTASLDRIDSTGDYAAGNVQLVHKDVNQIKTDLPQVEFVEMCRLIAKNHPLPNEKILSEIAPSSLWFDSFSNSKSRERKVAAAIVSSGHVDSTSRYKGVSWNDRDGTWHMRCVHNGKRVAEQTFMSEVEAARHYDFYAIKYLGRGCYLNFPSIDYSSFSPRTPGLRSKRRSIQFKGVHARRERWGKPWRAILCVPGRAIHLGAFNSAEEAAKNYDFHAIRLLGRDNCALNFPDFDYSEFCPLKTVELK